MAVGAGCPGCSTCALLVVIWAVSGVFLAYSDTWQLVINMATTVVTFLAVFPIQNSQNRDGAAMQAKARRGARSTRRASSSSETGTVDDTVDRLLDRY